MSWKDFFFTAICFSANLFEDHIIKLFYSALSIPLPFFSLRSRTSNRSARKGFALETSYLLKESDPTEDEGTLLYHIL